MENKIIAELTEEAKSIDSKLTALFETDEEIRNVFRGTSLWYSPIVEKPEVMFLGINPGAGFYNNNNHQLCHFFEPLKIMEYTDPKQDYKLKWEWMYVCIWRKRFESFGCFSKERKNKFLLSCNRR